MSGIQKPGLITRKSSISSPKTPLTQSRGPEGSLGKRSLGKVVTPDMDSLDASLIVKPQSVSPLPKLFTSHRDLSKCPCDQSKSTWKMDCSKCHQFWHVDCLGLQGLTDKGYNKLTNYLCPFCYVAPVPTLATEVDLCHVCRSTVTLQQSNNELEVSLAAEKLKSLGEFCKTVKGIDFDSLAAQLGTVESFDLHLQHFLIDKESLKEQQVGAQKANDAVLSMESKMLQLQEQVSELLTRPQPEPMVHPASTMTDEFVANISSKLDQICANEPVISGGLESLKSSVDALERAAAVAPSLPQTPTAVSTPSQRSTLDERYEHGETHIESCKEDFIAVELESDLLELFDNCKDDFKSEGGRSVLYFGEKYQYTGSRSSNSDRTVPPAITSLMQKINDELCDDDSPRMNSCLVNRFEGTSSQLPQHSDNEATIHPDSKIATLSLGCACTLTFSDRGVVNIVHEHQANARSLYSMTRKSQDFYEHRIDQGGIGSGVRYSLTFRSISKLNRNATCIIGDSNTGGLRFGEDPKRSFGKFLPGRRFAAPLLEDINPYDTCGFSNVVIMCGINNIKSESVKTPENIRSVYNALVSKIEHIQSVNPKAHVFVCPVLPTKRVELNRKGVFFNKLIMNELLTSNFGVTFVDGFQAFLDDQGLLNRNMSREFNRFKRPDFLHLNWTGLAKLGCLIRDTVLFRVSGVRRGRRTREVDGSTYRDVAAGGMEHHDGYQPS